MSDDPLTVLSALEFDLRRAASEETDPDHYVFLLSLASRAWQARTKLEAEE